jgi:diacylglycerol O-acyltransferase / wax synthase
MGPDRLSPVDASFLHIEDHVSHMHVASVAIFEGPPPAFGDVLAMVDAKLDLVPRYRQKVRFVPFELGRPVWVDDPHFNIEYHVRHTALPTPGGDAALRKLVGHVMAQRLDRSKPLWGVWVVEGLDDGRWAILAKTHHALFDGISGTDLLSVMMDPRAGAVHPAPSRWTPHPEPTALHLVLDALENVVSSPYEQIRAVRAQTRALRRVAGYALGVAGGLFSLSGLVRPMPPSSLNGPLGPHRRYAWATTSVSDIRRVRDALGGTFNDVVLASITNGFRELLLSRDEDVERVVRTLEPVSIRPRNSSGKTVGDDGYENGVSAVFAELPVDIDDPALRLQVITEQMKGLKDSSQALGGEALTSMSGFAPPTLLALGTRLATRAARNVNTVTANVPGPQLPLSMAGRRMIRAFPYVPLTGQIRLAVAIFSYNGEVNFGITGDYDSTPDIDVLASGIEDGMTQMLKICDHPAR